MSQQVAPSVLDAQTGYRGGFVAVIFNNDTNSFEEVIEAITQATGCTLEEAYIETWEPTTTATPAFTSVVRPFVAQWLRSFQT